MIAALPSTAACPAALTAPQALIGSLCPLTLLQASQPRLQMQRDSLLISVELGLELHLGFWNLLVLIPAHELPTR